VFPNTVLYSTA